MVAGGAGCPRPDAGQAEGVTTRQRDRSVEEPLAEGAMELLLPQEAHRHGGELELLLLDQGGSGVLLVDPGADVSGGSGAAGPDI